MKSIHFKHLLILLGINSLWGPLCMMFKYALISFSPQAVVMIRWGGIAATLIVFLSFSKTQKHFNISLKDIMKVWPAFWIGFFLIGPSQSLSLYAIQFISSIEAAIFNSTEPILATLLAIIIIKEYINLKGSIALAIGLSGSYIVAVGFHLPQFNQTSIFGNLIYLGAMLIEALSLVLCKLYFKNTKGILIVIWYAIGCFISSIVFSFLIPSQLPVIFNKMNFSSTIGMFYLIMVAGCFCFISWYHFVPFTPINIMSISTGAQPIVAVLMGYLFIKENITTEIMIGIFCILVSIGIASVSDNTIINYFQKFRIKKFIR